MIAILANENDAVALELHRSIKARGISCEMASRRNTELSITIDRFGESHVDWTVSCQTVTQIVNRYSPGASTASQERFVEAEFLALMWAALSLTDVPIINKPTRLSIRADVSRPSADRIVWAPKAYSASDFRLRSHLTTAAENDAALLESFIGMSHLYQGQHLRELIPEPLAYGITPVHDATNLEGILRAGNRLFWDRARALPDESRSSILEWCEQNGLDWAQLLIDRRGPKFTVVSVSSFAPLELPWAPACEVVDALLMCS